MKYFLSSSLLLVTAAMILHAQDGPPLTRELAAIISAQKCPAKSVSVSVKNLRTDSMVTAINGDTLFNPASVTKLITGAAAFELLGSGYFFTTRVYADTVLSRGPLVTVRDLYIQGAGDPSFTAERLWLFVDHLYHCGLRTITGDLIIDDYLFDSVTVGPGLDEDSSSRAYQPLIGALSANFSTIAVYHRPGTEIKQPVVIELFPENTNVKVINSAVTLPAGKKGEFNVATRPDSGKTAVIAEGGLPVNGSGSYSYRRVWQTWEFFGGVLKPLFKRRGIVFTGKVVHRRVPRRLTGKPPMLEFTSLPLSRSVEDMFKYSSNFTAEMLFKTFSARRDSVQGSWALSSEIVTTWWKQRNLPSQPILKNGSGMGNFNRLGTAQVVALLDYIWKQKTYWPEYMAALSIGGVDGTVKSRFTKSRLKGLVRAKTGTLNNYGVSTLAGYLMLDSGPYAFAIFCSRTGKTQYDDWVLQEKILEKVAEAVVGK
ncbi:MAG: D-alanyl-D-alanine carboxypeptidase/D-alanyl-D-alanine-endopeptidase [Chitinispirillaceae bacterium]|nr:D-alanyl-D-alanine carboxypeptidase/D-alanyl-D-alanine-endopeptidase [Chitinispirillaceae bacterium]